MSVRTGKAPKAQFEPLPSGPAREKKKYGYTPRKKVSQPIFPLIVVGIAISLVVLWVAKLIYS
jgi:hypothetical protein